MKKLLLSCFATVFLLLTTACSPSFNHADYVKGILQNKYYGDSTLYLKNTDTSEENAQTEYEQGIKKQIDNFFSNILLCETKNIDEDVYQSALTLYKELFKNVKFEVGEATEIDENKYTVTITLEPLLTISNAADDISKMFLEELNNWDDKNDTDMKQLDNSTAKHAIELIQSHVDDISYGPAEKLDIIVSKDSDGKWSIAEEDLAEVDSIVISYYGLA